MSIFGQIHLSVLTPQISIFSLINQMGNLLNLKLDYNIVMQQRTMMSVQVKMKLNNTSLHTNSITVYNFRQWFSLFRNK